MHKGVPIVSTKLTPPIIRETILRRPRLLEQLGDVLRRRATVLSAGPGYGKTTLLSALTNLPIPVIWYSLGSADRDLSVFTSYLIMGFRRHFPAFGESMLQQVSRQGSPGASPESIAGQLVNYIGELGGRDLLIVLDDFHSIDGNQSIRKAVDYLLTQLPASSHLVIATRRATRLPSLPRLRMIGEVNDITETDLRFTSDEIESLFQSIHGLHLTTDELLSLAQQTEGWVIGLQLAAQSLRTGQLRDADNLLASLGTDKRRLFEYLAEEVLTRQPASVQKFLCESSVLSVLSAESCDAIFERTDSAAMLNHIEQNNLFAVELDGGGWRYHHLFRSFLRQQAARRTGGVFSLHRRAAAYFERANSPAEAIRHFLAGEDYPSAVRLVAEIGHSLLRASQFDTLTYWIEQTPRGYLDEAPALLFLQAQVYELQGRYDSSIEWAERAAQAFAAQGDGVGLSRVLCSKAYQTVWRAGRHAEADTLYRKAMEYLRPENRREKADLLRCMALINLPAGNPGAAQSAYEQALQMYEEMGDREGVLATLVNPGTWIYWLRGDFAEGLASLNRAQSLAIQLGSKHWLCECLGGMSVNLRYLDRCGEAIEYGQRALALSREIGAVQLEAHILTFLGFAYHGGPRPDLDAARRCLRESAELAEREGNDRIRISALIGEVLLLRRLGDLAQAIEVGNRLMKIAQTSTDRWLIAAAQMNMASALIGQDDAQAEDLLTLAREAFLRFEDKWNLTCTNYWLAVLLHDSRPDQAAKHLEECLATAMAEGYGFWFQEERQSALPLLVAAARQDIHASYCASLLAKIEACSHGQQAPHTPAHPSQLTDTRGDATWNSTTQDVIPSLRIQLFGNLRVHVGNRLVQEEEWQRKKVKSLLAYLAASTNHTATRDDVVERFWGDLTVEAARAGLSRALHVLRRVLDPDLKSPSNYIASDRGLLRLRPERIESVDSERYQHHIAAAQKAERLGDSVTAEQEYEAAEALYTGDFLTDDPYEEWTIARREQLKNLHLSSLEKLARIRMGTRDHEGAILCLQRVVAEDAAREDAHALLMQCLARAGRRSEALAQFVACRRVLKQELQIDPMPETRLLYNRLAAGESI